MQLEASEKMKRQFLNMANRGAYLDKLFTQKRYIPSAREIPTFPFIFKIQSSKDEQCNALPGNCNNCKGLNSIAWDQKNQKT